MVHCLLLCHSLSSNATFASQLSSHKFEQLELWQKKINHFTDVCLVAWPLNESEAGVDLVLIETSLLFVC